jgi:hypothetical protein
VTVALDRRLARLLALTALGFSTLVLAAPPSPAATRVSASLCRTAERQDARNAPARLRFYRAWQGSPSVGPNWERAALVAGDMARIARSAIGAAELAEVETDDGRRLQAKLLRCTEHNDTPRLSTSTPPSCSAQAARRSASGGSARCARGGCSSRPTRCCSGQASSASSAEHAPAPFSRAAGARGP